ncbi:MAG: NADH-quinone oxidoreductase subunit L, partial [Candidatus Korarchaeota archaeon]|nr:NADH-quinone oxidoreductase subunit L [Candidatus Korarchaeota archaeon]NIU83153.1 NADH-quinone oxidoreductase subunit L [Candidatus Thorarchaeota archaeon]NIW13526.1 NADH-quinone oxidoreductase subunit L [Candidatus Thorarchaeota archaeon]NIW51625.1 NADH-quinone oxidoreductase subunit L [Candidatus Korarchaeota archaeon]
MFLEISWLVFLIPLSSAPIVAILEYLKRNAGAVAAILSSATSAVFSTGMLLEVLRYEERLPWVSKFKWIEVSNASIYMGVYVDLLSAFMCFIVSIIATLILIYSLQYMGHEREKKYALPRYFLEMIFFIGCMLGLVLSYDLIQMYIFWEGVGLASFLLIGFWWDRPDAAKGAKEAFIYTRIGDTFFLMGIVYVLLSGQTSFTITAVNDITKGAAATILSLCLFAGSIGKSAQLPLFPWLAEKPSAMQGPTTVSALIHAATMVKAGVFLVARFYPLFQHAGFPVLKVVAYVGGITSAFAGLVAVWKTDIKRVLGYSTISHLGFMFLALGVGAYTAGLFHLINHAIFKALLFLASGCVLHGVHEIRDMTKLGGLWEKMRVTRWLGVVGALAISGIPPFNGFWSKEAVLTAVNESGDPLLFFLGIVAAMTSAFYIWRWIFLIFGGESRSKEAEEAHEVSLIMTVPVAALATGAIISGLLLEFTGASSILPEIAHLAGHHTPLLAEGVLIALSLVLAFLGLGVTYAIYQRKVVDTRALTKNRLFGGFQKAFKNAWYFEDAYNF